MNDQNDERESIARYLEHIGDQTFGTLIDGLSGREVATFAASWVRNRLDEKWAAEVAANTPRSTSAPNTPEKP